MEETATKPPAPAAPQTHAPVMDIVAHGAAPAAKPATEQVAVEPEPPAEETGNKEQPAAAHKESKEPPKKPKPAKHKGSSSGVGLAIFATMVIVLGLAAMATYAYIQTQK